MKVAIPIFGPRVSPRFDCAPQILVVTVENGAVIDRQDHSLQALGLWERLERIRALGIQALICGGIDGNSARLLGSHGIQLVPWVVGEAEEVLDHFLKGSLEPGHFICPGAGQKGPRWARGLCRARKK